MKRMLMKFFRRKKVVGERPHGMREREVVACFSVGPNAPLWKGMNALIDDLASDQVQAACNETLPDKETHFALGGVAFAAELKARAMEYFQRAAVEEMDENKAA
jgi:hypothetical protein